jgi:hypothetical protein
MIVDHAGRLTDTSSPAPSDEFGDPNRRSDGSFNFGSRLADAPLDENHIAMPSHDPSRLLQLAVTSITPRA